MGDAQASDPHAMPLDAFVDEVMTLLGSEPTPAEINVQRVLPLRHAEARGPEAFAKAKAAASPRERKVWALWHQLHRDGLVNNPSRAALDAWVERTVHVSALRFATAAQLDTCIEALKSWQQRGGPHA